MMRELKSVFGDMGVLGLIPICGRVGDPWRVHWPVRDLPETASEFSPFRQRSSNCLPARGRYLGALEAFHRWTLSGDSTPSSLMGDMEASRSISNWRSCSQVLSSFSPMALRAPSLGHGTRTAPTSGQGVL